MLFGLELGHLVLPVRIEDITIRSLQALRHLVKLLAVASYGATISDAVSSYILPVSCERLGRWCMASGRNGSASSIVSPMC